VITHNEVRPTPESDLDQQAAATDRSISIVIQRRSVLFGLLLIATGLFCIDLTIQTVDSFREQGWFLWPHLLRFFNLDGESSFPTWYAVTLLSGSALLTGLIALVEHRRSTRFRWHWALLTLLITGFSIDEGAKIHDSSTGTPLRDIIGTSGLLYYAWVIPALISALVVALMFARFMLTLPARTRALFALAAFVFLIGAIGFEMVSGWYADRHPDQMLTYATLASIEEFFEMCGVILLIAGLLDYADRELERTDIIWRQEERRQ